MTINELDVLGKLSTDRMSAISRRELARRLGIVFMSDDYLELRRMLETLVIKGKVARLPGFNRNPDFCLTPVEYPTGAELE